MQLETLFTSFEEAAEKKKKVLKKKSSRTKKKKNAMGKGKICRIVDILMESSRC